MPEPTDISSDNLESTENGDLALFKDHDGLFILAHVWNVGHYYCEVHWGDTYRAFRGAIFWNVFGIPPRHVFPGLGKHVGEKRTWDEWLPIIYRFQKP